MENETEKIIEKIENSAQIKFEIDEDLKKKMNELKKSFENIFDIEKKFFNKYKDIKYYTGGYPSESSPPKIDSMIEPISELLYLFEFVNDTQLKDKFKSLGINISFDENIENKYTNDTMTRNQMIEMFNILVNDALVLQSDICLKSDEIKINNFEDINNFVDIDKSVYNTLVNVYYRQLKELEIDKIREKIKKSKESFELAESII